MEKPWEALPGQVKGGISALPPPPPDDDDDDDAGATSREVDSDSQREEKGIYCM